MSANGSLSINDPPSRDGSSTRFSVPKGAAEERPDVEAGSPSWYDSHARYIEHDTTDEETCLSTLSSLDDLPLRRMREHQREAKKSGALKCDDTTSNDGGGTTRSSWSSSDSRRHCDSSGSGVSTFYSVSLSSISSPGGRSSRASDGSQRNGGESKKYRISHRPLLWPTTFLVGLGLFALVKMGFVELRLEIDQFGSQLRGSAGGGKKHDHRRVLMVDATDEDPMYGGRFHDFESLPYLERQREIAQHQTEHARARTKFDAKEDPLRDDDKEHLKLMARKLARQHEQQQELRWLEQEKKV